MTQRIKSHDQIEIFWIKLESLVGKIEKLESFNRSWKLFDEIELPTSQNYWESIWTSPFQTFQGMHLVGKDSWKKRELGKFEVRKFIFKFKSTNWSWKVSDAVLSNQKFFNFIFSNFISNFPTSHFFELPFPTSCIPFSTLKLSSSRCFQLHFRS